MTGKIDVHGHIVPPCFREALIAAGGDPAGWTIPEWNAESTIESLNALGVASSVLSVTSPGCVFLNKAGNKTLARQCNEYSQQQQLAYPTRFSFYASLPNVYEDMEGALEEINYAYDVLGAEGVLLFPHYDGFYLGHSAFIPLWKELARRKCTVLIHPTTPKDYKPIPEQKYCPCPSFDFPHETTRCVSDIIMSGRKAEFPEVNVILCHGGGTVPYLAARISMCATIPFMGNTQTSPEIMELFKTFFYDSANCGASPQFQLTVDFVPQEKLVYGTDLPYAPLPAVKWFTQQVDSGDWKNHDKSSFERGNAAKLFPRLA